MTQKNRLTEKLDSTECYEYIVDCKDKTVRLAVDGRDVFHNADDEIDCPLDVVLRKNDFTLQDLMNWDAREVKFVKMIDGEEIVLNSVSLNVNL